MRKNSKYIPAAMKQRKEHDFMPSSMKNGDYKET